MIVIVMVIVVVIVILIGDGDPRLRNCRKSAFDTYFADTHRHLQNLSFPRWTGQGDGEGQGTVTVGRSVGWWWVEAGK